LKYEALYRLTTEQGGATVRLKDYPETIAFPTKGFAVGDGQNGMVLVSEGIPEVDEARFDAAIDWALAEFPGWDFEYMGTWIDGTQLYVDPVNVFASRDFAMGVAFERGEQAIFDLANKKTIQIRRKK
jgi:hypothetical protein